MRQAAGSLVRGDRLAAVPSFGRAAGVQRPSAASADATSDLYERYSSQIFGYCLHQLGSREEAEDAVQTTFMNAFRGLQRGIVPELESAWLFKIAHNVCLSRRRSSWRRGRVEAPNNLEVLQEVVPAREQIGDELIRLQDVLEEMPDSQRRAILLREWQGLTYREIANELELSQSAVETLIFRARRALAAGLEHLPSGERDRGWRKRARHAGDAGAVAVAIKTLLSSGAAAKIALAALVAAATAIAGPIGSHTRQNVQHAAPTKRTSLQTSALTRSAPVMRNLASASQTPHHAAPGSARPGPRSLPTAPVLSAPESKPAPAPPPAVPPPASAPARSAPQPDSYRPTSAPPTDAPGKSGEAPGKARPNQPTPPAADPSQPSDPPGQASAPGQQDNPGKSNGHK
jgi:RNA polymerase sigma factor (sigma-70 family)